MRDLGVLVHQRRGMWRDMGVGTAAELDEADTVFRRWARQRLRTGKLVGFLAVADGRIVSGGCVWLQEIQPRPGLRARVVPYFLSMYTEPEYRRQGIAKRIVEEAVRWSRGHGYPRISLHASEMGRSIYAKLGFEATTEMRLKFAEPPKGKRARRR